MPDLLLNIAKATHWRQRALSAFFLACSLFPVPCSLLHAAEQEITFREEKIYVEGLSGKVWVGNEDDPDTELILIFSNAAPSAVNTLRSERAFAAQMLLVGGGGAGGYGTTGSANPGGGGGGGHVLDVENANYAAGTYTITVGAGGARTAAQSNGENGYPSIVSDGSGVLAQALGGGGGGAKGDGTGGDDVATGGGGGGQIKSGVYGQGGIGVLFNGGSAINNSFAGGGGGVNGNGANSTVTKAGDGGAGTTSTIWDGSSVSAGRYGGGGGGGQSVDTTASNAGVGADGGGHGGYQGVAGANGLSGSGGGGGGGGKGKSSDKTACGGGAGGSGVVIIRLTWIDQPIVEKEVEFHGQKIYVMGATKMQWVGDKSSTDAELILVFDNSKANGLKTLRTDRAIEARVLAVGGGGAGGYGTTGSANPGGGGGGGQVLDLGNSGYGPGTYSMVIGEGGARTTAAGNGENGHPSFITNEVGEVVVQALGGGGGGARGDGNGTNIIGMVVATGGGGGGQIKSGVYGQGGLGTLYNGGSALNNSLAGGGGGAGGNGVNSTATHAGDGGLGVSSQIWADEVDKVRRFGGGGGGGQSVDPTADYAGVGVDGGGHGGYQNTAGGDATPMTGGGGGGGGRGRTSDKSAAVGGAGGSGIIVIRLTYIEMPKEWKEIPVSAGGYNGKIWVDVNANWEKKGSDIVITYSDVRNRGGLCFHDPTNEASTVSTPVWAQARILAVGGGGGGGMINERSGGGGGGGGAGGVLDEGGFVFNPEHEYDIIVGAGGAGGVANEQPGENGGNSLVMLKGGGLVMSAEAMGGGGGGAHSDGLSGASGGGGSRLPVSPYDRKGGKGLQGFDGGETDNGRYSGAGGGGAGGAGGNAMLVGTVYTPGAGGAGVTNNITGSPVVYAGGGGGAAVHAADLSSPRAGGAGGSDVGGKGAGVEGGKAVAAGSGKAGTGSGGGGGVSYAGAAETAGDGGSGVVIIRLSGFVVQGVAEPKTTDFTYDGTNHAGVAEFYAYDLTGTPVAVNANRYAVTATLKDVYPDMIWADTKGREPRTVYWTIHQLQVEMPGVTTNFVYNGKVQTPVDKEKYRVDENGYASVSNRTSGLILRYCHLEDDGANVGYERTDTGDYTVKAVLYTEPGVTNFTWIGGPDSGADHLVKSYGWRIVQAPNRIVNFYYPGYRVDRLPAHHPTNQFDVAFGRETTKTEYREEKSDGTFGDWQDWGSDGPSEKGNYEVRVAIDETKNWQGTTNSLVFGAWEKWSDIFTDRMEVTVGGNSSGTTPLTDFPVPVRVREPDDDGYSPFSGFEYVRAGATGKEVKFFDSTGDPVEHEVDVWNVRGESLLWVRVPSLRNKNTTLTMCWRRVGDIRVPGYEPERVWKAYAGVWHFSQRAEDGVWADSSGNERHAHLTSGANVKTVDGKIGKALYVENGDLLADGWPYPADASTNLWFTYTGWYRNPDFKANTMFAGVKFGATTPAEMKSMPGWCLRTGSANNRVFWEATNAEQEKNGIGWNLQTTWGMLGFGNDGAASNGAKKLFNATKEQFTGSVSGSDQPLQLATGGFEVDEVRVSTNYLGDAWVKETYNSINGTTYCTCGLVIREELICDYWTTKPSLAKTVWREDETWPTEVKGSYVATTGGGAGAAVTATYRLIPDGEPTTEHPTAKGHYRATYDHTDPAPYRPQPHTIDFYIIEATVPVYGIGGNGGDSGRILLMNADNRTVTTKGETYSCGVTNQGWCARSDTGVTYWRDCPSSEGGAGTNNVMPGTAFELVRSGDTNVLWRLYDCRQGNTFPTNDSDTTSAEYKAGVYLPPSSGTALSITNESVAATRGSTGWVLMRNIACPESPSDEFAAPFGACVYSPCYSNGIGTVYFDAVNSRPAVASGAGKNDEGYKLVLEVATSTTNGLPPYDEYCYSTDGTRTNWYGNLIGMWKPVEMSAMTVNDTKDLPNPTNCLALAVKNGGQTAAFYRIHARVDVHTPCRFRIRRVSIDDTPAVQDAEGRPRPDESYILLDNIIASFPPVVAELKPYGSFDSTLGGVKAVGYGGAFETPFPSAAEGASLTGRCTVVFTGDCKPDEENFSLKQMFYRWRYLEQLREPTDGDWKAADLQEAGDELRTSGPLETPAEAGDIEFHFVTILRTPYYGYVDYTGLNKPVWPASKGGYTEEGLPHESRYEARDDEVLASGGRDWFIRLRDGRSNYEGLRLLTRPSGGDGTSITTNDFELVGDGQWTVRLETRTAVAGGLDFRIEGLNPQTPGSREYAHSTDCWISDRRIGTFPAREGVSPCTADEWGWLACDAATGWLYFQLDLDKGTLQVAHAEAEDFSKWSSAVNEGGLFVGSAVDTNTSSTVTRDYDVNMAGWTASAASDPAWQEDFGGDSTVTIERYPRNAPFSTARSRNGWTAESAMWTYGKWSLQNNPDAAKSTGDDSAVQLEGRGKGRLSFIDASKVPDGLDTVTYRARVGQVNDFNDFARYDWYLGTSFEDMLPTRLMNDYTFATIAALTETGAESYDGDGSVSLVGLYNSDSGCYEFRVSRGTNDKALRLALFRWNRSGGGYTCTPLYDSTAVATRKNHFDYNTDGKNPERGAERLVKASKTIFGGLFLSVRENGGKTYVTGGVCETDVSTTTGPEAMSGQKFTCITYRDSSASRLSKGTFGLLSCNCPAVFAKPICYRASVQSVTASSDNVLQSKTGQTVTFDGTAEKISGEASDNYYTRWEKGGRVTPFTERNKSEADGLPWGFRAAAPEAQNVKVQVSVHGQSDWQDVYTETVKGFTDAEFRNVIHDPRQCDVRLQTVNSGTDARTDVIVNDVSLTQWNGQWTPNWDTSGSPWYNLTNKYVYTSAWVQEKSGRKSVRLQPSRAKDKDTPVSLRSPLMRGLGLVHFTWRDADPRAKIRVQYKENVTFDSIVNATKTLAEGTGTDAWTTFETIDVGAIGASGSKTVSINRRYAGKDTRGRDYYYGLIRLVIDKDVQAEAISGDRRRSDEAYGAVTITDMFTWDLPEYDVRGWNGWNFRAAGWDGTSPDGFANVRDAFRGLSGILNNTLDADTLADREKDHYAERLPGVQSPAFRTNSVGAISFRARLCDADDLAKTGHGAVITVYGCNSFDEKGEPTGEWKEICDVEITNRTYAVQSVKIPGALDLKAVRLAVKGVKGVTAAGKPKYDPPLRVALDDIVIWERLSQSLAFRKHYVRPFRDATAIKGSGVVPDIAEMSEQPLLGESFGFQAEVEVLDPDEVIVGDPEHPITVDLWYYQGGDVWGFENWKTNPAAVRVAGLMPATDAGDRLVFRSTVEQSASLCPPQFAEEGEGYRIVQYHVVAHYSVQGSSEIIPHDLQRDEWSMPEWNAGFRDPNDTNTAFSAFTLLEEIAPGRAWINEISYCEPSQAASLANQWIELAVPSGVDMTGWTVEAYDYNGDLVAELATLGLRGAANKKTYHGTDPVALASHYAFYTIKSPYTVMDGADAVWPGFNGTGALDYSAPYAFALKRPTGVVEHRVVAQGWNQYRDAGYDFAYMYDGTNLVRVMHGKHGGEWTWSAEDLHGSGDYSKGVSVITNQGFAHGDWVSPLKLTPGDINGDGEIRQYISPDWYVLPNGGYVKIYSSVLGSHMRQIIGGMTNTVGDITISQGMSTNIVYEVDRWYKLGPYDVKPNERAAMSGPRGGADGKTYYTLSLNQVSNRIDITVRDDITDEVADMLDPKYDAYRPAIMKWLEKGVTGGADGGEHPFRNPNGPLKPMHYRGTDGTVCDELKLPDLYWLDVDPTDGDWELWGGMGDRPGSPGTLGQVDVATNRVKVLADGSTFIHTNHLTTVWMELRNTNEEYAVSYPPYRIQGLGNEQSDLYTGVWTSGNFKVTMRLANGKVDDIFQPMRYFVFGKESFRAKDDPVAPYAARVEIVDPFSDQSPASEWGWQKYSDCNVFTGWALDGRVTPGGVSTLKKNDLLEY